MKAYLLSHVRPMLLALILATMDLLKFPISLILRAQCLPGLLQALPQDASFYLNSKCLGKSEATYFYFTFIMLLASKIHLLLERILQFLFHQFHQQICKLSLAPKLWRQLFLQFRLSSTPILCQSKMDLYRLLILGFL